MAILIADTIVNVLTEGAVKVSIPCTGPDTFYKGAIVWTDTSGGTGLAQVGSLASGDRILGICAENITTTAANDLVTVYVRGLFQCPAMTNVTGADIGDFAVMDASGTITDNPADLVASGDITLDDNDAVLGRIVSYLNSLPVVELGNGTGMLFFQYGTTPAVTCLI